MRTPPRDKTEAAVQALMDLDVRYAHHNVIADALRTILPDLPPLPAGWDGEDGESGTPEQAAQHLAQLFLDAYDNRGVDDPFGLAFQRLARLDRTQEHAVRRAALDAVGEVPGFKLWAEVYPEEGGNGRVALIHVYEEGASVDLKKWLTVLPAHATRREVMIAVESWRHGFERGQGSGRREVRAELRRIREQVLEVLGTDD
ncbi:hypothetical protein [Methylobacterium sp. DCY52]|nr:hypothetical protein [Methylobacterium sp. 2A]